ncbi:undecaprenyl diphosphate synthase [Hamiltosporidium magnivora]|uniref:Undecaprenyl diphosphate synthase n=1 Tax=Hamiltosporidium magnivora TaxID=148818 RepID=A0A4V2JW69_9MICR|nr:undecaprenyl diphosphate synthase [Hamiltosporidium magnivora]
MLLEVIRKITVALLEYLLNSRLIAYLFHLFSKNFILRKIKIGKNLSISFIMDGNRRYAKKSNQNDIWAKQNGFKNMLCLMRYCSEVGFKEISFFALSLSNLQRDKNELEGIYKLIIENKNKLMDKKYEVRVVFHGRFDLVPIEVYNVFKEVMVMTKDNKKCIVNIFFAYSSTDVIKRNYEATRNNIFNDDILEVKKNVKRGSDFQSINIVEEGLKQRKNNSKTKFFKEKSFDDSKKENMKNKIKESKNKNIEVYCKNIYQQKRKITKDTVNNIEKNNKGGNKDNSEDIYTCLRFNDDRSTDIIVRTSGELRLSDFRLEDCAKGANIFFCKVFWPEFTVFHVFLICLKYKFENKIIL